MTSLKHESNFCSLSENDFNPTLESWHEKEKAVVAGLWTHHILLRTTLRCPRAVNCTCSWPLLHWIGKNDKFSLTTHLSSLPYFLYTVNWYLPSPLSISATSRPSKKIPALWHGWRQSSICHNDATVQPVESLPLLCVFKYYWQTHLTINLKGEEVQPRTLSAVQS